MKKLQELSDYRDTVNSMNVNSIADSGLTNPASMHGKRLINKWEPINSP